MFKKTVFQRYDDDGESITVYRTPIAGLVNNDCSITYLFSPVPLRQSAIAWGLNRVFIIARILRYGRKKRTGKIRARLSKGLRCLHQKRGTIS